MRRRRTRLHSSRTTVLCVAGLVVAGIGLAYCVHLGAQRDDETDESTSAASLQYVSPSSRPAGSGATGSGVGGPGAPPPQVVSQSKMLLGTVVAQARDQLTLQMSDGRRHQVALTDATHFDSDGSGSRQSRTTGTSGSVPVKVGDLVVVHVLVSGGVMTADLVVDGRVTASRP